MSKHLVFGWTGDSITEGYGDNVIVSCQGIPGRYLAAALRTAGAPATMHVNMGASGAMVPQYLDIAKSIIDADPTKFTAISTSIWSPNIPVGETAGDWPTRPENLAVMVTALQSFETFLLDRSIVFLPAFMAASPFATNETTRARLQVHLDNCLLLWPWLRNLNTPVQDPAYTDGPRMSSTYSTDATHPTIVGYQMMYDYDSTRLMTAFNQACAAYGFVEL